MTIPESTFRSRLLVALERIADALEAANEADPVRAIAAALAPEREGMTPLDFDMPKAGATTYADLPPAQRRAMGLE